MAKTKTIRQECRVEYHALLNAIHRCHNEEHLAYGNYGARGIQVCEDWRDPLTGFMSFLRHMGRRPCGDYSLDRIDNNRGYEPGNCRWTDRVTQQRNQRPRKRGKYHLGEGSRGRGSSPLLTCQGITMTVKQWADALGMKNPTLRQRVQRGWPVEKCLTAELHTR